MARFLLITVLLALLGLGAVTVMRGFGGQGETRLDQSATDLESPDDPIVHRRVASDSGEPIESRATTPADRPERTAVVSGRLRSDRGEDLPGAGITLVATPLGDATAGVQTKVVTTNAYGAFEAKGIVRPSLLEVVCRPLTHQVVRQRMMLPDQDSLDLGNIICESGAGLSGVVVDASGVPVADAEVLVEEPATGKTPQQLLRPSEILGRTKTADDGRFSLRGLPSGAAHLVVKSETHPTGEVDVEGLRVGFDLEDVVVQLPLGRVVSGRVVDEQGQAIEGASLVALNAGSALGVLVGQPEVRSAQSDAEGRFRFEGLRLADLRFDAWHPGFLRAAGVAVPAEVAFFQVEMRRAPWVFGQLLGPQGPIGRAARLQAVDGSLGSQSYTEPEILLGTAAAEALGIESEPGLYAVVGLTGQAVTLLFEAPGCVRQQVPLLELPPGEGFRLDMKLKAATPVRGQVVDSRTGAGIADAIVRGGRLGTGRRLSTAESLSAELRALLGPMNEQRASLPERVETRSDAEGNFQLDGLDVAQGVEVTARHPEFLASEPVKASGTEELTLSLTRGAVLQGQVWNPRRDPAVGARVVVRASGTDLSQGGPGLVAMSGLGDRQREARAGPDGRYHITGLPAGAFRVEALPATQQRDAFVVAIGLGNQEERGLPVQLVAGETTELDLDLREPASLQGQVTAAGKPVAGATIRLESTLSGRGGAQARGRSDGSGGYQISGLEAGDWIVQVTGPEGVLPVEQGLRLGAGEQRRLDLELPAGEIAGVVRDAATKSVIKGAVVSLIDDRQAGRTEGSADTRAADTMRALLGQLQEGASLTGAGHQRAHAGGRAVVADAEGRFEFRFLPAGRYRLTARVSGYVEGSEDEILLGQDAVRTDVVLTVEPAGTLRLEVGGDPESGSALNLSVFAVEGGDIIGSWLVRAGRSRTVHGLAPGRYRVTATTLTSTVEELIEVRAGEEARLEF